MKTKLNVILAVCSLTLLMSCEPGDLVNLPTSTPRLVILSFNQVGDPWRIYISESVDIRKTYLYNDRKDAIVKIYENDILIEQLTYDIPRDTVNLNGYASFSSKTNGPKAGHTYEITAEAPGFPKATAKYTQPEEVPADIKFTFSEKQPRVTTHAFSNGSTTWYEYDTINVSVFDVSFTFKDPPGNNYYDFWVTNSHDGTFPSTGQGYFLFKDKFRDNFLLKDEVIDDTRFPGKQVTFNFEYVTSAQALSGPNFEPLVPKYFRFALRSMNEAQFKFVSGTRRSMIAERDPYAQPVRTYTNVQNGLGVFGGYTPSAHTFYYELEE